MSTKAEYRKFAGLVGLLATAQKYRHRIFGSQRVHVCHLLFCTNTIKFVVDDDVVVGGVSQRDDIFPSFLHTKQLVVVDTHAGYCPKETHDRAPTGGYVSQKGEIN